MHDIYLSNGSLTVSNSESFRFIKSLGLAKRINLAVAVKYERTINPAKYRLVINNESTRLIPLHGLGNILATIISLPRTLGMIIQAAHRLVKESDIIWLRIPSAVIPFFSLVAKKYRKPLIFHVSGNILLSARKPKYRGIRYILSWIVTRFLHLFTKWIARYGILLVTGGQLVKLFDNPIHPAYQLDDILFSTDDLILPRKTQGKATNILFVGRFDYGKGCEILIDAIDDLRMKYPQIKLKMAGVGPLFELMKRKVIHRNLSGNVDLLGFVPADGNLQKLYRDAQIFVLPSDSYPEGFPRCILEAWTAGLSVVATNIGGVPYRVKDHQNGLVVSPGSKEELVKAIDTLVSDSQLRYQIAIEGYKTVSNLTFEHQAKRVRSIVRSRYPDLFGEGSMVNQQAVR